MPDRILDFSEDPAHLAVRHANLLIRRRDKPDVTMPLSDVGVVVASHPAITCTLAALAGLSGAGAAFVACDEKHLPVGMMLPLQGNYLQSERMAAQLAAKLPVKKRLWQQIVRTKIQAQAAALSLETGSDCGLRALAARVRSGDPENVEAQAARRYWSAIFDDLPFKRDHEAQGVNSILNYGYAIVRAMTGRALCAVGLHPSIGLHHHNRYSQFVLADDLMEPFRVVVDRSAVEIAKTWGPGVELTREVKMQMLESLTDRYRLQGEKRTLFDIVARAASSLVAVFAGETNKLVLPGFPEFFADGRPNRDL